MADLKWLEEYSGQSTAELIALEGAYRIGSLVLAFEQGIDQKAAADGYESLTETTVLAIEALKRVGCLRTAEVTGAGHRGTRVCSPPGREQVAAALAAEDAHRDRQLEQCDADYLESGEDIAEPQATDRQWRGPELSRARLSRRRSGLLWS